MDKRTPPKRTPTMSYAASEAIFSPALPELTEKELDELFSKAFEQHEQQSSNDKISTISAKLAGTSKASVVRNFGKPVSSKDISEVVQKAIPHKTQQDNKYCANMWNEWVIYQAKTTGVVIPYLKDIKVEELQHWICSFLLEIRKKIAMHLYPTLYTMYELEL